jgi:peptide/nickel transport system permease protein
MAAQGILLMIARALNRLLYAGAVILAVTSFAFALIHLSGDPLAGLLPPGSSPEQEATIRRRFDLDRPLAVQYTSFLTHAAQGDFGESWRGRQPAMTLVLERLPATLKLTGAAIAIALLIGIPLGIVAGSRPGGSLDAGATGIALLGQALPGFWLGTLLIMIFAVRLRWLPASGEDGWRSLILPAITLAAYPAATITRLLRAALIETMHQEFIRTARGKGLPGAAILRVHALQNAALPTLAFVGLQIGFLLGGAVVVESVFAYPGIGRLALQAVADRDLPVIQAFVVVIAILIVALNMAVDALAHLMDPRLRSTNATLLGGSHR